MADARRDSAAHSRNFLGERAPRKAKPALRGGLLPAKAEEIGVWQHRNSPKSSLLSSGNRVFAKESVCAGFKPLSEAV